MKTFPCIVCCLALAACRPACAGTALVWVADGGMSIDLGPAGKYPLAYPRLRLGADHWVDPSAVHRQGDTAHLDYPGDARADVSVADGHRVTVRFRHLPADAAQFRVGVSLPIGYAAGGTFAVGDDAAQPFPAHCPANPMLHQGNAGRVRFVHPSGAGFQVHGPTDWTYEQVQDDRAWRTDAFEWFAFTPLTAGQADQSFTMTVDAGGTAAHATIDRYGQIIAAVFPEKVTTDAELTADVARDAAYYGSLHPPAADPYGGRPNSGAGLARTGFFHPGKAATPRGPADVLVTPDGNASFELGVCGGGRMDDLTLVAGRESLFESLPSTVGPLASAYDASKGPGVISFYDANLVRKFGQPYNPAVDQRRWIDRWHRLGFNTAGAFSFGCGPPDDRLPETAFLPIDNGAIGTVGNTGVWDAFADAAEAKLDHAFASVLPERADDPMLVGYFAANEPPLEDVPQVVPGLGAKSASKRQLAKMLAERYPTVAAFNAAWNVTAPSMDALADLPLHVTTEAADRDVRAFFDAFLERRYGLVERTFRKYDNHHLLLGDRLTPGTAGNRPVVEAVGRHVDVMSVNYYAMRIDAPFLGRVHAWGGNRPLLLSEFHFATATQGQAGGFGNLPTQADRGRAYRAYVEQAAATGFVVGIQWFECLDQAATGRWFQGFNGEGANTGLVNVCDRPYKDFLAEVVPANSGVLGVLLDGKPAYALPAASGPAGPREVTIPHLVAKSDPTVGGHAEFPGVPPERIGADRIVLGAAPGDLDASFRLAWDDVNLYVYVQVTDPTPMHNDAATGGAIWSGDAIELFVGPGAIDQTGAPRFDDRHVLLRASAAKPASFLAGSTAAIPVTVHPSSGGYTLKAAIPLAALGVRPEPGRPFRFDLGVDDSADGVHRQRQLVWSGTDRNSQDRSGWGRAVLVP